MNEWKKVTDELPDIGVLILCCGKTGGLFLGHSIDSTVDPPGLLYIVVPNSRTNRYATHWMDIPPKPRGVK